MQITIIGAGNMGRGIATRALSGGHSVQITTDLLQATKAVSPASATSDGRSCWSCSQRVGDLAPQNAPHRRLLNWERCARDAAEAT